MAKIVANKLSFVYIDTGAMYRACTFIARKHGLDYGDEAGILKAIDEDGIVLEPGESGQKVLVAGEDVSLEIRTRKSRLMSPRSQPCRGSEARWLTCKENLPGQPT